ncbi:MAG: NAD(P)/FAD-dependent oxidoreductase [Roseicyclus sp.]
MAGICIVGAGHGGTQLAASLRDEGYEGPVALISDDADLPYHKPPLSKSFMKTADAPLQSLRAESFFAQKGIDLRLGRRVAEIDRDGRTLRFGDGTRLAYDRLVLATGARARRLTVEGADLPGVYHLRTAEDARAMRAGLPDGGHVVVVGGGFIGLEAAAMLAGRGLSVEILEAGPRLLGRAASPETAAALAKRLSASGVRIRCNASVERLSGGGRLEAVHVRGGDTLAARMLVVGIGAVPCTGLAEACGLRCDDGIVTDALLTTSDPAISAMGDVAVFPQEQLGRSCRLESVQNATDHARALARTLTGKPTPYRALPWFWSDIGETKLQIAGLADGADDRIAVTSADGALQSVWHMKHGVPVAVETLNAPGLHMLSRRLIAECVAPGVDAILSGDVAPLKDAYAAARREVA